jgi:hypothetical protein
MTAMIVDFIEQEAYTYANTELCYPTNDVKKIPSSKLFDLVAGTSTGSLIASALAMPG